LKLWEIRGEQQVGTVLAEGYSFQSPEDKSLLSRHTTRLATVHDMITRRAF
jgi:hypothetical protein